MLVESLLRNRRGLDLLAAVCCFGLFGYALYSQQYLGLTPCPLCIFQRVAVLGLGACFLLAAIPSDAQLLLRRAGAVLLAVVALVTASIAARHYYIQHLPPGRVPVCGATLDYLLDVFPLTEVLRKVLTGSGECAKVDWTFLGLSMPGWVFLWAAGLGSAGFALNWRRAGS